MACNKGFNGCSVYNFKIDGEMMNYKRIKTGHKRIKYSLCRRGAMFLYRGELHVKMNAFNAVSVKTGKFKFFLQHEPSVWPVQSVLLIQGK